MVRNEIEVVVVGNVLPCVRNIMLRSVSAIKYQDIITIALKGQINNSFRDNTICCEIQMHYYP